MNLWISISIALSKNGCKSVKLLMNLWISIMENYMKVILFVRQVTHELVDFNYNGLWFYCWMSMSSFLGTYSFVYFL